MAEPARNLYDPEDEQPVTRPHLRAIQGGGESTPPERGHLRAAEEAGDTPGDTTNDSPERLRALEGGGETTGTSRSRGHLSSVKDEPETPFTSSVRGGKDQTKAKISGRARLKRWGIGSLVGLAMGGAGFGFFNMFTGPLEFIHFAKLLHQFHLKDNEDFGDNRTGQLIRFRPTASAEQRNLSGLGNKVADHFEKKLKAAGITPGYEFGRIRTLTIDTRTPTGLNAIEKLREQGIPDDALRPGRDGKVTIDIDTGRFGSARFRRQAISGMVDAAGMKGIVAAVGSRKLKARADVDFHPLKNAARALDEDLAAYKKKRQDERAQRHKNGATPPTGKTFAGGNDANPKDPNAAAQNDSANAAASEANEMKSIASDTNLSIPERSDKIRAKVSNGVGVTAFLGTACSIQLLGNEAAALRQANVVLPLIRVGMEAVIMGNQVMSGKDVSLDELGAFHELLYDKKTKTSWADAASIQAELNQKRSGPDMPDAAKPGSSTKPGFFRTLDGFIGSVPAGNQFCSAVNSTAGSITLSVAGIIIASTGPVSALLNTATEAAQYILVGAFMDDLVRRLAGEQVDMYAAGATLGNYANYGTRLASNDIALTQGGRRLSAAEERRVAYERDLINQNKNKHKSFYARYIDINETDSLLAKVAFEQPTLRHPDMAVAAFMGLPSKFASNISKSLLSPFSKNTHALTNYNYGFPRIGYSVEEVEGEGDKNPYARGDVVEPKLAELNEKYGSCFNVSIDPATFVLTIGEAKRYDEIDSKCDDPNNQELLEYRFYIADMVAMKVALCYEDIDEAACQEVGMSDVAGADSSTGDPSQQWRWPYHDNQKTTVNSCFGMRWGEMHAGIDIFADGNANAEIVAAADGEVTDAGPNGGYGNFVAIKHANGMGTSYGHLSSISIKKGPVKAGQVIGRQGNTGESFGSHLHFNVFPGAYKGSDDPNINPLKVFKIPANATNAAGCK